MKDEFENLSISLDESGATGGNFLDNAQPFMFKLVLLFKIRTCQ